MLKPSGVASSLLTAIACVLVAPAVRADCETSGTTVTCSGASPSFLAPGGQQGLTVNVNSGADVSNASNSNNPAIRVNAGSTQDSGSKVINRGEVVAVGAAQSGISGADFTNVQNHGEVRASGASSIAVRLGPSSLLSNKTGAKIQSNAAPNVAPGVAVRSGSSSRIINRGLIQAIGAPGATGVDLMTGAVLKNYGRVETLNSGGRSVRVTGTGAEVRNFGELVGKSDGIAVDFISSGGGGLLDNRKGGVLRSGSGNTGLSVRGSVQTDTIINAGFIKNDVLLLAGDDRVKLSPTGRFGAAVDGGLGNDTFVLKGGGGGRFSVGSVDGFERLRVKGGDWAVGGEAAFADGITLVGGRTRPDGTLRLTGDLTLKQDAELQFLISPDGSFDRLVITGAATLEGTLSVRGQGIFSSDVEMLLLSATAGISGEPEIDIPADSALLDYDLSIGPEDIRLRVTREGRYPDFARSGNQRTIAKALDELFDSSPTGETAETLGGLDALDAESLRIAFERIGPEYYDAHSSTALTNGVRFTNLLLRRPDVCELGTGREGDACGERGLEPWATGWGGIARRRAVNRHVGFRQRGGGLVIGANVRAGEHVMLAGSIGGSRTQFDVEERGDGSLSQVDLGVGASLRAGMLRARGAVSYGHGWHDSRREIDVRGIGRHATSEHESDRVGGAVELGAEFPWKALRIEPTASVDVTYLDEEKIKESGAGSLDLVVSSRDVVQVGVGGGVRLSAEIDASKALLRFADAGPFVFIPELTVGYRAVVAGDDRDVDARLADAPSSVGSLDVEGQDSEGGTEIGVGFSFQPEGGMTMGLGYGLFVGDHTIGHSARLSLRVPFFGL